MQAIRRLGSWIWPPLRLPKHATDLEDWPEAQYNPAARDFLYRELKASADTLDRSLNLIDGRVIQMFNISLVLLAGAGVLGTKEPTSLVMGAAALVVAVMSWGCALQAYRFREVELGTSIPKMSRDHAGASADKLRDVSIEVLRDQVEDFSALRRCRSAWFMRQMALVCALAILTLAVVVNAKFAPTSGSGVVVVEPAATVS